MTDNERTFTQEQQEAMYKSLLVAYKALHSNDYRMIAFAQGYVGECLDTLHSTPIDTPAAANTVAEDTGRRYVVKQITDPHIVTYKSDPFDQFGVWDDIDNCWWDNVGRPENEAQEKADKANRLNAANGGAK